MWQISSACVCLLATWSHWKCNFCSQILITVLIRGHTFGVLILLFEPVAWNRLHTKPRPGFGYLRNYLFLSGFALKWQNRKFFNSLIYGSFTQNRHDLRSHISREFLELWRRRHRHVGVATIDTPSNLGLRNLFWYSNLLKDNFLTHDTAETITLSVQEFKSTNKQMSVLLQTCEILSCNRF